MAQLMSFLSWATASTQTTTGLIPMNIFENVADRLRKPSAGAHLQSTCQTILNTPVIARKSRSQGTVTLQIGPQSDLLDVDLPL